MTTKVFVDGQEGTTGLKIFEYLSGRRDIEVLRIDDTKRKDVEERRRLINASDVTFLCLPDVASRESVSLVDKDNARTVMIDASTAFRTQDDWAYGLPELSRAQRNVCVLRSASPYRAAMHRRSYCRYNRSSRAVSYPPISTRTPIRSPATAVAARR